MRGEHFTRAMKSTFNVRFAVAALAFITVFIGSVFLVELAIPFLQFQPNVDFLQSKRLIYHLDWWRWSFYIHVFSSPIVIFAGLFQFNRLTIHRFPKFHRICGYIYILVLLLIACPSGFLLGLYANGSYPTQVSFTLLSVFWFATTIIAFKRAKSGMFESHAKWMIRSYALTLSAISLRAFTFLLAYFKIELYPPDSYILVSYASWIINLIVAEVLIYLNYAGFLLRKA